MSKIEQIPPEDIKELFINRINQSNILFTKMSDNDSLYVSNNIFFSYYFDIFTSIEACLRGIACEAGKKNTYINYLAKPKESEKAFFLNCNELKAMIDIDKIKDNIDLNEYENDFFNKINKLHNFKFIREGTDDKRFFDEYKNARDTRNRLAHGIKGQVEYSNERLEEFLYVFYALLKYYYKEYKE